MIKIDHGENLHATRKKAEENFVKCLQDRLNGLVDLRQSKSPLSKSLELLHLGFLFNAFRNKESVVDHQIRGSYIAVDDSFITLFVLHQGEDARFQLSVIDFAVRHTGQIHMPRKRFLHAELLKLFEKEFGKEIDAETIDAGIRNTYKILISQSSDHTEGFQVSTIIDPIPCFPKDVDIPKWMKLHFVCEVHNTNIVDFNSFLTFEDLCPKQVSNGQGGIIKDKIEFRFMDFQTIILSKYGKILSPLLDNNAADFSVFIRGALMNFDQNYKLNIGIDAIVDPVAHALTAVFSNNEVSKSSIAVTYIIGGNDLKSLTKLSNVYTVPGLTETRVETEYRIVIHQNIKSHNKIEVESFIDRKIVSSSYSSFFDMMETMYEEPYLMQSITQLFSKSIETTVAGANKNNNLALRALGQMMGYHEKGEHTKYYVFTPDIVNDKSGMTMIKKFYNTASIISFSASDASLDEIDIPDNIDKMLEVDKISLLVNVRIGSNDDEPKTIKFADRRIYIDAISDKRWTFVNFESNSLRFSIQLYRKPQNLLRTSRKFSKYLSTCISCVRSREINKVAGEFNEIETLKYGEMHPQTVGKAIKRLMTEVDSAAQIAMYTGILERTSKLEISKDNLAFSGYDSQVTDNGYGTLSYKSMPLENAATDMNKNTNKKR